MRYAGFKRTELTRYPKESPRHRQFRIRRYSRHHARRPIRPYNPNLFRDSRVSQPEVGDSARTLRCVVCGCVNLAHPRNAARRYVHSRADAVTVRRRRAVQRDFEPVVAVRRIVPKQRRRGGGVAAGIVVRDEDV